MRRIFAPLILAVTLAGPALARSCDPTDVSCLKDLAVQAIVTEIKGDEPRNQSGAGRRYAKLVDLLSPDEIDKAQQAINRAGPGESFWSMYDMDQGDAKARRSMNYQGVEDGIMGRGYPKSMKWGRFIDTAIPVTLNGPDADKLVALYLKETARFTKYAERASGAIIDYMARSDIEMAEQFGADPDIPKTSLYRTLGSLGRIAAQTCRDGDIPLGKRIMAFRDTHAETQQYSEALAFLPLIARFDYILACEGEAQARIEFDKIEDGLEKVPNGEVIVRKGLTLSVDRMRSEQVMDSVVRPLAHHLADSGRLDEARALFIRYIAPSVPFSYDPTTGAEITAATALEHPVFDGITKAERADLAQRIKEKLDYEWERELEIRAEQDRYSNDAATRMDYFMNQFDPKFEICCSDGQGIEDMIEEIEIATTTGLVPAKAIARALELSERAKAADQRPGRKLPVVRVTLATAQKTYGCALKDDAVQRLFNDVFDLDEPAHLFEGLLGLITYQQTPLAPRTDAPCVIK